MFLFLPIKNVNCDASDTHSLVEKTLETILYLRYSNKIKFTRIVFLIESGLYLRKADFLEFDFTKYEFSITLNPSRVINYSSDEIETDLKWLFSNSLVLRYAPSSIAWLRDKYYDTEFIVNAREIVKYPEIYSALENRLRYFAVNGELDGYPLRGCEDDIFMIEDINLFVEICTEFKQWGFYEQKTEHENAHIKRKLRALFGKSDVYESLTHRELWTYGDVFRYLTDRFFGDILQNVEDKLKGKKKKLQLLCEEDIFIDGILYYLSDIYEISFTEYDLEIDEFRLEKNTNIVLYNLEKCSPEKIKKIFIEIEKAEEIFIIIAAREEKLPVSKRLAFITKKIPSLKEKSVSKNQLILYIFSKFHKSINYRGHVFLDENFNRLLCDINVEHLEVLVAAIKEIAYENHEIEITDVLFWYILKRKYFFLLDEFNNSHAIIPPPAKRYFIEKHRNILFVNFGYDEPLYMEISVGWYYIWYALINMKFPYDPLEVYFATRIDERESSWREGKLSRLDKNKIYNSMFNAIDRAKESLKENETLQEITGRPFSVYLKTFVLSKKTKTINFKPPINIVWETAPINRIA